MNELVRITEHNGSKVISARELHEFLEVETRFSDWIKRMFSYGFEEDLDYYSILSNRSDGLPGKPKQDYALTLDCAKEISMLQRNEKGKQARRYFIEVEKKTRELTSKPKSTLDILKMTIQEMESQRLGLDEVRQEVQELKAKTTTRPDYFTIAGYATCIGTSVNLTAAAKLGRTASGLCKARGLMTDIIPDKRFGRVNLYPKKVLEEVFRTVKIN